MKKILINLEEIIAGVALGIMTVLTVTNVFVRLFISRSLIWADEISYIYYAYVIFVGGSALYKRFGHSAIDLVVKAMPEKAEAVVSTVTTLVLTVTNLICFVLSIGFTANSVTRRTQLLKIPYAVESMSLVIGFGLMTIHSVMFLKNTLMKRDYFHIEPIYQGLFDVDALQDQIDAASAHQQEKSGREDQ